MAKHGKKYMNALKQVDEDKLYPLTEGLTLAKQVAYAGFDETVEIHVRLGIDPRHSDQQVRSTVLLPAGLGKKVTIVIFAEGEDARLAESAGADMVGGDDILDRIQKENWIDFDAALATPSMMKKVGRVAKILGPRGLMPNPKAGTVVNAEDLARAVQELKAGRVEFRNDKTGNLHIPVGKKSFSVDALVQNAEAVLDAVTRVKPNSVKGIYIKRITVTTTMGPGIDIEYSANPSSN